MKFQKALSLTLMVALLASPLVAADDLDLLRDRIYSENDKERLAARQEAAKIGARAIPLLVEAIESGKREPSITARHALTRVVHHAGRPEASVADRTAVIRQLELIVTSSKNPYLRRESLWLIGFIGGDTSSVAIASRCLADPDKHIAEIARLVLERMPGDHAKDALLRAIRQSTDGARRADLIFSLSKKSDPSVAGELVRLAGSGAPAVRFAALSALARLGVVDAIPVLRRAAEERSDPQHQKLVNELLRLADNVHDSAHAEETAVAAAREKARSVYAWAATNAPADFQRERALHRLSPLGDDSAVEQLIVALNDASKRVRRLALRRLAVLEGEKATRAIVEGFASAKKENQPILLRAIAERDAKRAKPLIERSKASEDVELRIVAHDLAGDAGRLDLESDLLEVAQSGSEAVRETATRGYISVAEKRLAAKERAKALAMFDRALGFARDPGLRSRALRGWVAAGDATRIDKLAEFLADPVLAVDAANGYVTYAAAIGQAGDKNAAETHLLRIATGQFPREIIARAAEELRAIGRDPQAAAIRKGFLLDWWLTGPIQDTGDGLTKSFEPETKIDLTKPWTIGPRRYRWRKLPDLTLDGRVNLLPVFRRSSNVVAYAYAEVDSSVDQDVVFKIGSDDGCALFVNGERIHLHAEPRGLEVDQDTVKGRLRKGKNRLLLKIQQGSGDWGFAVRVTQPGGEPLILRK